jgi:ATP-dependent DNA ligase
MPPSIAAQLQRLPIPDETVIDAEFMGPRGGHKPEVYIFDCLAWDGEWLLNTKFIERWQRCQELANGQDIHLAETRENGFLEHFNELKSGWISGGMEMDLCEGIVLKRKRGKLELDLNSSKKSRSSFKLKYREIRDERY